MFICHHFSATVLKTVCNSELSTEWYTTEYKRESGQEGPRDSGTSSWITSKVIKADAVIGGAEAEEAVPREANRASSPSHLCFWYTQREGLLREVVLDDRSQMADWSTTGFCEEPCMFSLQSGNQATSPLKNKQLIPDLSIFLEQKSSGGNSRCTQLRAMASIVRGWFVWKFPTFLVDLPTFFDRPTFQGSHFAVASTSLLETPNVPAAAAEEGWEPLC